MDSMMRTMYTSPIEAINPAAGTDTKYIHMRFALMDREVRGIISGFYSVIVLFAAFIEFLPVEAGTISPSASQWIGLSLAKYTNWSLPI